MANPQAWHISSTPRTFQESELVNDLASGFNRARISWNTIDSDLFYGYNNPERPPNISNKELSNHHVKYVPEAEVFSNRDIPSRTPTILHTFNINYFPDEKGPYNYETNGSAYSAGLHNNGKLINP